MRTPSKKQQENGPIAKAKQRDKSRQARLAAMICMIFSGMVAALVVLAGRTDVPQITRAPGTIVPLGDYTQIEVMEGGIVERVHVRDGDQVKEGDVLVELRHPDLSKEQHRLREQIATADRKLSRARTVLRTLESGTVVNEGELEGLRRQKQHRAAATLEIYAESQRVKSLSIAQQQETLDILQNSQRFTLERIERKKEELARARRLHKQGLTTLRDLAREADQLDALRTTASDGEVRLAQTRSAVTLAQAEMAEQTLTLREEMLNEVEELSDMRSELAVFLRIVDRKLEDLQITAPSVGIIQSVAFPNEGEVIAPGETIFELLPTRLDLMVEARIPNNEIGHVGLEQPVDLTVDTYDVRRFGKIQGQVAAVSPVPLIDEQTGETYFRASIQLDGRSVGTGAYERPLQAGMTVVAEMTTGEKTLLAYMLKPVHQTMNNAFNER
ncbi:type I secretion membrane fusion protein, HlyD family (plasmid) [Phaeobacter gallaeciensis]|uniref:Membrane fusion protein (MFP) family protein n=2 Tax=Phaeobacter gallaeciensis TaxID=60890 RepID=A0AAD0EF13_9RHOB|nr:type I secretion membrane fusion protein, HlyD family [Phaeobacter gallaeciensis DSM 26640]ATE94807.1 type I secretion membrane fusion protein, HlyD family [Phaeobacter gallaeciensis]ATE99079.1 type I secretion membrane fusion protein, HlyD family [Phaeobacter gallaeciensis]ATF03471.1 type I secretion membrane fusion protein, HlyD family [Phaeobacter gallaeciensis]ATF07851.1 type I secretion membrane fusion protein, HlyD family [Phaeobacter gallaeciensis]